MFGISVVFTLNNLVAFLVWTVAGASIARLFAGGTARRAVDAGFAACLIGVGVWMLLT